MNFTPHYKYMRYAWEETSNAISTTSVQGGNAACFKNNKYCSHSNLSKQKCLIQFLNRIENNKSESATFRKFKTIVYIYDI